MFGLPSLLKPQNFLKAITFEDLVYVNKFLASKGLPPLFLQNQKLLNASYKIFPTPRFVWSWSTFSLRIAELYLRPFAQRGESNYAIFANHFYKDVPTDQLPDVIDGPEIKISFD